MASAIGQSKMYANDVISNYKDTIDANLVEALWIAGNTANAWTVGWEYLKYEPKSWPTMTILLAIAIKQGKGAKAEELIAMFDEQRTEYQYGQVDYAIARAYGLADESGTSLKYLNSAIRQGKWNDYDQFQNDFAFIEIKDLKEFKEICNYWNEG